MRTPLLLLFCNCLVQAVHLIRNGLAPPEIVHSVISSKPRCTVTAPPLDLVFILDSSGSLRNKFQDEVDVIRRIVRHVTIGPSATRVMLVQFSGTQHLEFDFNAFNNRDDLMSALDVLRHVSGITRVGAAFEFTHSVMTPEHGMRDSSVKKVVFLLSDGRTHDFPKDSIEADLLRQQVPNSLIWAYGTGEFVAMNELINITKDETKIITNKNLPSIEPLFDFWHGVEVCEKIPECVKGSDKPLDLVILLDSSDSIESVFDDQITFIVERIVQNIHVHPDAVRLALLTYSGRVFERFLFNDFQIRNNSAVIRHFNDLKPIKGTTSTHLALERAYQLFADRIQEARPNATKLVIVLTDGRSSKPTRHIAERLRSDGIHLIAVSLHRPSFIDTQELEDITGSAETIFTPLNLADFENTFLKFVGFGCPNVDLGPNSKPRIRGATDVICEATFLRFTVRTQRPMNGLMYANGYHDNPECMLVADGKQRELSLTIKEGTCGMTKSVSPRRDGYLFNATIILQFHPLIVTRADQGLDVGCFHAQSVMSREFEESASRLLTEPQCTYRMHRFGPEECAALDAKVGETLFHKWECDIPQNYRFLVHDCFVKSDHHMVQILDSNGCQMDPHFLETPNYSQFARNTTSSPYVFQEASAFKFPGDDNLLFQCHISLCDMTSSASCVQMIPPACGSSAQSSPLLANGLKRSKRATLKSGFVFTKQVETRTLNVIDSESIQPTQPVRYCDIRS